MAIANDGTVVGYWFGPNGSRGYAWTQTSGALPLIADPATGAIFPFATAFNDPTQGLSINASGVIAGLACIGGCSQISKGAAIWTAAQGLTYLGSFGGGPAGSLPAAINDVGQVVGTSAGGGYNTYGPFIWSAATGLQRLTGFVGLNGHAQDINNSGLVVGTRGDAATGRQIAFVWSAAGGQIDIPDLPGTTNSYGLALNDGGVVVGHATLSGGADVAFRWSAASGTENLGAPGGVELLDINNAGDIVGTLYATGGGRASYLYRAGTWTNVLSLLPAGTNFVIGGVRRLNDRGSIIGIGGPSGSQGFVLIPPNRPPTATDSVLTTTEDVAASGTLSATDPEGAPLTYRIVGNGVKGTATISNPSTGAFAYVPYPNANGPDTLTFVASDGSLDSNVATVAIAVAPVNDAPVALNATASVTSGASVSGALAATDVDSTSVSFSIVTNGAKGQAVVTNATTGAFTYQAAVGTSGLDVFTFRANDGLVDSNTATVAISIAPAPTRVQAPTGFRVDEVIGSQVRLRWDASTVGPPPAGYIVEGGLRPSETLGSIATGPVPILTFMAPRGSFFVRVKATAGSDVSAASNEVPLHVNVPVAPSAPVSLTGLVDRGALDLRWRNSFGGGAASGINLNLTGAITGVLRLGLLEGFHYNGMPAGTYTFSVSARNAAGTSVPSNAVTLTFPGPCSGPPNPPVNFLFYGLGGAVYLLWDPPTNGSAPTTYELSVSGAYIGSAQVSARSFAFNVPPGTYTVQVTARNNCGASTPTAAQTVIVP